VNPLFSNRMKRAAKIIGSLVLGLGLLGLWLAIVDIHDMVAMLTRIRILYLPLMIGLFFLSYFLRSLRWKVVISPIVRISAAEAFHLSMTNHLVNFLVPVHAGEAAKCLLLKKIKGTLLSQSLAATYMDKAVDLLPIVLGVALAPFVSVRIRSVLLGVSGMIVVIWMALMASVVFILLKKKAALAWAEKALRFFPKIFRPKIGRLARLFVEGFSFLPRLSRRIPEILGLTFLAFLVQSLFLWIFFSSFGIRLSLPAMFVGYGLLNVSFLIPAPPGYSGSLELIFIFIFSYLYGYDKNPVSAVAVSSHIFTAVAFGLFGLAAMAFLGTRLSAVFKMSAGPDALKE
jgi:glycosyltransferase 2 family protein